MSNKPGIFGVRLRYWLAAAGVAAGAAVLNNGDEEPVKVSPAEAQCSVTLDDKIGIRKAAIVDSKTGATLIDFTQGINATGSKYTGEGMGITVEDGKEVRSTVGDFSVAVEADGTRAVSCEVENRIYEVSQSHHIGAKGDTYFVPRRN